VSARRVFLAVLALAFGSCVAKARADSAALAAAGYRPAQGTVPQAYFTSCASDGKPPSEVARCMPAGATVERTVVPNVGGADSALVELYVYRAALIGRWPVQVYYRRGGGVEDVYAQDQWPSIPPGQTLTLPEAEAWLRGPGSVSPGAQAT
jgi:hypothetical protein